MPKASVRRNINKKKDKLIEFVLDIEKYPEFIPFCLDSKVYDRKEENNQILIIADLTIGKGLFSDTYKSDVRFNKKDDTINVTNLDGPLKHLQNNWKFIENNNITEISILNTNLPQNPTKPEALNHVRSHFKKEMKLFTKHLLEQLSGSDLNSDNFNSFVYFVQTLIISLDDESPLYNDDSFYDELDTFSNYTESKTICIENSDIVPCFLSVKKATYSIGNSGCRAGEFRITFGTGFYAPFGLGKGSKIKIDWEFSPSGKTGFWLMPIKNGKKKVNGRTKTVGCFNFGSKNELTLFISLSDHEGRISNTSHIILSLIHI